VDVPVDLGGIGAITMDPRISVWVVLVKLTILNTTAVDILAAREYVSNAWMVSRERSRTLEFCIVGLPSYEEGFHGGIVDIVA